MLKHFEKTDDFQEVAKVFEDETASQEEIKEAGLQLLMNR